MIDLLAKVLIDTGLKKLQENSIFKDLSESVRDRFIREIKFNLEIFDYFSRNEKIALNKLSIEKKRALIQIFKIEAFSQIESAVIPLKNFFPEKVDKDLLKSLDSKKFNYRIRSVTYLHELIEQMYFRLRIYKATQVIDVDRVDLEYMNLLLLKTLNQLIIQKK